MRIKVHSFYQDISGNKISAGEHDSADLKGGIAQYLVDNGHAVYIGGQVKSDEQAILHSNDNILPTKPKRKRRKKTS